MLASVLLNRLTGRTPHGVRGLKYPNDETDKQRGESHPSRGAWIEMSDVIQPFSMALSHPSRGAWIEMESHGWNVEPARVAPLTGCVD